MGIFDYFSSQKGFERKLKNYEADILNASRDFIDNSMLLCIVVFRTIAGTYKRIEQSHYMFVDSHLERKEYDKINEHVSNIIGHSYISNWDQMKNGNS